MKLLLIIFVFFQIILIKSECECGTEETCCTMSDGNYGCCTYDSGNCCSDGVHCCPPDSPVCDGNGNCHQNLGIKLKAGKLK